ncbi:pheA operon leader peptide PheL [Kluyvera georgiana]|nr:pheA operon leader peptide PheL [Kluyvera georgiana]MDA8494520.1 pheA operon leader peptide PheL [Kluyvera georgiana]
MKLLPFFFAFFSTFP